MNESSGHCRTEVCRGPRGKTFSPASRLEASTKAPTGKRYGFATRMERTAELTAA
jgi:hypothetical protein